jgi:hypothetical protein
MAFYITSRAQGYFDKPSFRTRRVEDTIDGVWFMLDLAIEELCKTRFEFATKQELMEQLLIPAATMTKTTDPTGLANQAFTQLKEIKKIVEIA